MFEEITASSLVKVDLHGKVVGPTKAMVHPAGFTIHSAMHAARTGLAGPAAAPGSPEPRLRRLIRPTESTPS